MSYFSGGGSGSGPIGTISETANRTTGIGTPFNGTGILGRLSTQNILIPAGTFTSGTIRLTGQAMTTASTSNAYLIVTFGTNNSIADNNLFDANALTFSPFGGSPNGTLYFDVIISVNSNKVSAMGNGFSANVGPISANGSQYTINSAVDNYISFCVNNTSAGTYYMVNYVAEFF